MSFNRVILVGNVGKDPEIRRFETTIKASFSLATSETYTPRGGEKVTQTEWHNIVAWRRLAELAENYIRKGTQLLVEGKLRYRSYDDREGNKRYIVEVEADTIQLLGRRPDSQSSGQGYQSGSQGYQSGGQGYQSGGQGTQSPGQGTQSPGNSPSSGLQEEPGDDLTASLPEDDLPF